MRDFFIRWMERLINVAVILGAIGVFLAGGTVFLEAPGGEGLLMALVVWLVGALYLFLVAGLIYLGLGIYNNTRRTAEAVEQLVARS